MQTHDSREAEWTETGLASPTGAPALESPFTEMEELEFAAGLLDVNNDAELDQFLSGLLRKAASAAGRFMTGSTGQALGGLLKGAIKQALPAAGAAWGGHLPEADGTGGSLVAAGAGPMLGLELEGLSEEDREFETAKQLVRLSAAAAGRASTESSAVPPATAARQAVADAARLHAPGLLKANSHHDSGGGCRCRASSGRWERSGADVILHGL